MTTAEVTVTGTNDDDLNTQSTTEGEGVMVSWKFDEELCRQTLTKMIIIDELPFKFVEREGFRYFLSVLQPKFKLLSRFTVVRDCLALYAIEKKKLKTLVSQLNQRICFTTDIWTSIQNLSYMCLTANFIDKNWTLHKRILNFCIMPSHKGKEIGRVVETCLLDWGIDKLCTLTVDNASSNDLAVAYLKENKLSRNVGFFLLGGECFHMRCCAHILNLIVKDGLSDVNGSIVRIREAMKYVRSSPQRGERFQACVKRENITFKSHLCLNVSTRWNSTYLMLEVAVKFQKTFERLEDDDIQFLPEVNNKAPSSTDWEYARVLIVFLKKIYDATNKLFGSLYVTSNRYFHEVLGIEKSLNTWSKSPDIWLSNMATKMKIKFDKYWGSIEKVNMLVVLAVVLDPRYKLKFVEFCYSQLYSIEMVHNLSKKVMDTFNCIFSEYVKFHAFTSSSSGTSNIANEVGVDDGNVEDDFSSLYIKCKIQKESSTPKSEVEKYLEEACEDVVPEFDILNWWKVNGSRYTILSEIARDILAVPVSTVASESAFSTGGRVLDQFRSSLTPKLVECLICTQDWLQASPTPIDVEEKLEQLEQYDSDVTTVSYSD
ncbi:zinc finger BED domain-containing protein RICESLEEPER 2-like [Cornus florida]|uniref:zinc finger BED domain-containing protein RICESLEEPER 2-like n=1 Tax=Cornus florida TaxID=4283 RepID=UPI00289C76F1|nr:zinc finger BED domain-containing protein RICESLEEPER 2-like [Cornus florida]